MKFSKIKSIKKVGKRKVFDLEVPKYHNFHLSNGVLSHNSVDLDTRYGINYIFASQIVEDVPDSILKQSKYIFIPATADVSSIKFVLINTGMAKNIQTSINQSMRLKRQLKNLPYSWIVINRMTGVMELVKPLPPLSYHLETSK